MSTNIDTNITEQLSDIRHYYKLIRCDVMKLKRKKPEFGLLLDDLKIISNEIRKNPENVDFDTVFKSAQNLIDLAYDIDEDFLLNVSMYTFERLLKEYHNVISIYHDKQNKTIKYD